MFKQVRICLLGATGMVGTEMIEQATDRQDVRIIGVARREIKLPPGARMEMLLSDPSGWTDAIPASGAKVLVCAIGSGRAQEDGDETTFREVHQDLVVACAKAAKAAKIEHMILLSASGASIANRDFYLHVRGKMEDAVAKVHFKRLDILRPAAVHGGGALDKMSGSIVNLFRKAKSIPADKLARMIFALTQEKRGGRLIYEHDRILEYIKREKI